MKTQKFTSYWGAQPRRQQSIAHPCDVSNQSYDDSPEASSFGLLRGYFHGANST